ncbi:MAG: M23 family metallopeptidase [Bacteroidetes bacterium]|nr:M23 family metallopeptidase [Bacteroidota bacterium]MDA0903140.1 M23 family metallopeptidase [Bacteroidota bacterium]MDA1242387.1 M23 family metallopeptidase [Bacteroidota bacterium]
MLHEQAHARFNPSLWGPLNKGFCGCDARVFALGLAHHPCLVFRVRSRLLLCLGMALVSGMLRGQTLDPVSFKAKHEWVNPLDIPLYLSGNFGELRGNHFHTGVDLKTEGREGLPVLAATAGCVGRVKMSPWGYGNALYLEGPDGVTTVYAHLQSFESAVQTWAVARTYKGRTLGLDANPMPLDSLCFQAGDTLGWSGNTGGSGGPHLHFEIRSTNTQHPLNPLDGWIVKEDSRPPVLGGLWIEGFRGQRDRIDPMADTVEVPLTWRASVEAYDLLNGANNVCGIRTLSSQIEVDGRVVSTHEFELESLDFGVNKDMNAHTLYPVWAETKRQVHRLHRLSTNALPIYQTAPSDGWIHLKEGQCALVRVEVTDAAGNASLAVWKLKGRVWTGDSLLRPSGVLATPQESGGVEVESASGAHAKVTWPANVFYEPEQVSCDMALDGMSLHLEPTTVPYRKGMGVSWRLPVRVETLSTFHGSVPAESWPTDRWVFVQTNQAGEPTEVEIASFERGLLHGTLSEGGHWHVQRDTLRPEVKPYHSGSPLVGNGDAVWWVDDALSGVDDLDLRIDGKWARVVWDPKRHMVTYQASDGVHPTGISVPVSLRVTDSVGNQTSWNGSLQWRP